MRISKKFAGRCIGKLAYSKCDENVLIEKLKSPLKTLEEIYLKSRLKKQQKTSNTISINNDSDYQLSYSDDEDDEDDEDENGNTAGASSNHVDDCGFTDIGDYNSKWRVKATSSSTSLTGFSMTASASHITRNISNAVLNYMHCNVMPSVLDLVGLGGGFEHSALGGSYALDESAYSMNASIEADEWKDVLNYFCGVHNGDEGYPRMWGPNGSSLPRRSSSSTLLI
jgi:hypothetical protein